MTTPDLPSTPHSPGVLTSEFWLTVLGVWSLVGLVLHGDLEGQWAAGAISFACFGYQASRAIVKRAAIGGDAQVATFRADLATLADPPAAARPRPRKAASG